MNMTEIDNIINEEKKQAIYEEESLADLLFEKEDLLYSGESIKDINSNMKI